MNSEPQSTFSANGFPSGWFKRTPKACASCRQDKIRCNGIRPCDNCSRRGLDEHCIDGCDPCRRARVRCEAGRPCQRCRTMHIVCTEESSTNLHEQDTMITSPKEPRNPGERTKLACLSCRRDNKKCDDRFPCSRCTSRSEECVRVARAPKLLKLRCEACRRGNKRCEDNRPCKTCVDSNETCITLPRRGKGHGTRVKSACIGCRRDKVRCDGFRPCSACTRKGSECIERACFACSMNGRASECTHRKQLDGTPQSTQPDEPVAEPYEYELSGYSSYQQTRFPQYIHYPNGSPMPQGPPHSHIVPAGTTANVHRHF